MKPTKTFFSSCTALPYTDVTSAGTIQKGTVPVADEVSTEVFLNGIFTTTLVSSPHDLCSLAAGYCLAENRLPAGQEIRDVIVQNGTAQVVTGPAAATPWHQLQDFTIRAADVYRYGNILDSLSAAHHRSHGIHEGALVQGTTLLAYAEDIGRHNVLDRLRGTAALHHIDVSQALLIFSGRVPQSVIVKAHAMGLSILASRAMPSTLGIRLADQYGMTLLCGLRTDRFRIFTHGERILV
jgi:FdhD protein